MKVLVTGAHGQVSQAVIAGAPDAAELKAVGRAELDISDDRAVAALVAESRPDLIVNGAAYTAVDRAESEPEHAARVNDIGAANLARAAAASGARLIHLSTDFVFDGSSSKPYLPDDPPNPVSVYGATKLAGERSVRALLPDASVILRTAWVYDATGKNFLRTMLRLMKERGTVRVVADQVGTPTAAHSIAQVIWAIAAHPGIAGVFHWTDAGVASWYDFAVAIAEESGLAANQSNPVTVVPIETKDYPTPARRPRFSVLDKTATTSALGIEARHWRQNLRKVIGEISVA
jgi:dTDP-4-dehydrorhamnose reductase